MGAVEAVAGVVVPVVAMTAAVGPETEADAATESGSFCCYKLTKTAAN